MTVDDLDDEFNSIPTYEDDEPESGGSYTLDDIEDIDGIEGFETIDEDEDVNTSSSLPDVSDIINEASDLIKAEEERDSYLESLRQIQADFENYKKRVIRDTEEYSQVKSMKLIGDLLGVLDNFELAIKHFDEEEQDEKVLRLRKGIELVYSEFYGALEKQGLERIKAEGEVFDPEIHEAVLHDDSGDGDVELVVEVLRPGYVVRGKVIRPAMVKVAK